MAEIVGEAYINVFVDINKALIVSSMTTNYKNSSAFRQSMIEKLMTGVEGQLTAVADLGPWNFHSSYIDPFEIYHTTVPDYITQPAAEVRSQSREVPNMKKGQLEGRKIIFGETAMDVRQTGDKGLVNAVVIVDDDDIPHDGLTADYRRLQHPVALGFLAETGVAAAFYVNPREIVTPHCVPWNGGSQGRSVPFPNTVDDVEAELRQTLGRSSMSADFQRRYIETPQFEALPVMLMALFNAYRSADAPRVR